MMPATLAQAQECLLQLRRERRAGQAPPAKPSLGNLLRALPPHLGWHSQAARRALRRAPQLPSPTPPPNHTPAPTPAAPPPEPTTSLYPDLALALLRRRQVPAGRVWLLLRYLDDTGQGWIREADARAALSGANAPWRLCGPRQLRNLLAAGAGLFWTRAAGRLWLHGLARVAAALEIAHFSAPAVRLPVRHLTGRVAAVRAQFYASFHSGRGAALPPGIRTAPPIARQTLTRITRVSRHTQRRYEAVAGVRRQVNLAVGAPLTASEEQDRACRHGHATFRFIDRQGRQGPAGQTYVAWQLPNSYLGPHPRCARRQRRRLNRRLADLLHQGTTGNGKHSTDQTARRRPRRFCRHGRGAAQQLNRTPTQDAYWPHRAAASPTQLWHVLPGHPEGPHGR